eukprot:TRINITY_DN47481_c0_g1_i1.p1 TRINITY_DN47481_c0_g1~~TRINITY_DN47481_c0_g1_i1.p1  ORF type:complete len:746 (+),score=182.84 TRINITY_DN47481_c0_g1_i1:56-2293(+)
MLSVALLHCAAAGPRGRALQGDPPPGVGWAAVQGWGAGCEQLVARCTAAVALSPDGSAAASLGSDTAKCAASDCACAGQPFVYSDITGSCAAPVPARADWDSVSQGGDAGGTRFLHATCTQIERCSYSLCSLHAWQRETASIAACSAMWYCVRQSVERRAAACVQSTTVDARGVTCSQQAVCARVTAALAVVPAGAPDCAYEHAKALAAPRSAEAGAECERIVCGCIGGHAVLSGGHCTVRGRRWDDRTSLPNGGVQYVAITCAEAEKCASANAYCTLVSQPQAHLPDVCGTWAEEHYRALAATAGCGAVHARGAEVCQREKLCDFVSTARRKVCDAAPVLWESCAEGANLVGGVCTCGVAVQCVRGATDDACVQPPPPPPPPSSSSAPVQYAPPPPPPAPSSAGSSATPAPTSVARDDASSSGTDTALLVVAVCGGSLSVLLGGALLVWCCRSKRRAAKDGGGHDQLKQDLLPHSPNGVGEQIELVPDVLLSEEKKSDGPRESAPRRSSFRTAESSAETEGSNGRRRRVSYRTASDTEEQPTVATREVGTTAAPSEPTAARSDTAAPSEPTAAAAALQLKPQSESAPSTGRRSSRRTGRPGVPPAAAWTIPSAVSTAAAAENVRHAEKLLWGWGGEPAPRKASAPQSATSRRSRSRSHSRGRSSRRRSSDAARRTPSAPPSSSRSTLWALAATASLKSEQQLRTPERVPPRRTSASRQAPQPRKLPRAVGDSIPPPPRRPSTQA